MASILAGCIGCAGPLGRRHDRRAPGALRKKGRGMSTRRGSLDDELIKRDFPLAWAAIERLRQLGELLSVPGDLRGGPADDAEWHAFLDSHPELHEAA
jgi:hypothetical protein